MKNLFFSLVLAVLIGVGCSSVSFASPVSFGNATNYNRTINIKSGFVYHANTLIVARAGTLRYISGDASSSNAVWTIYDSSSILNATFPAGGGGLGSQNNILIEGGQATQFGSIGPIDLGDAGINFNNGLVVVTTTADLTVLYY